jgi:hypothetical protein
MVIVTSSTYPLESATELAKKLADLPAVPDYMTKRGPYVQSDMETGIVAFAIYELDKAKVGEGMEFLGDFMCRYRGVPGFRYTIKPYFEASEALKMIGF